MCQLLGVKQFQQMNMLTTAKGTFVRFIPNKTDSDSKAVLTCQYRARRPGEGRELCKSDRGEDEEHLY